MVVPIRPLVFDRAEDLRDDVASALKEHGVADTDVFPGNFVLVVEGGVLDHDASDGDGLELGDGGQRTGAADLNVDVVQDRRRSFGREFIGNREARCARDEAQTLLQVQAVELVDDAVDVVVELGAPLSRSR